MSRNGKVDARPSTVKNMGADFRVPPARLVYPRVRARLETGAGVHDHCERKKRQRTFDYTHPRLNPRQHPHLARRHSE